MSAPGPGDPAPTFALPAAPGEVHDLDDYLGGRKVVLLFYPLAFSGVCTTELCTIRDSWPTFEEEDAAVFGISIDSLFVTRAFREAERLPFPLLSDFNKDVAEAYGVLETNAFGMVGVAKRSVFVIGTDAKVAYAWVADDDSVEPDYDEVRAALAAAL
ncbi:MAG: peroxiredoxin [Gemmatimonadota bacterium]|nr:peroxiredoxin [Gemmatimonadota bacterium]